jgi:hypothetical protein
MVIASRGPDRHQQAEGRGQKADTVIVSRGLDLHQSYLDPGSGDCYNSGRLETKLTRMDLEKARHLLELDIAATRKEIREAYRRAARRWHPDAAPPEKSAECHQHMLEINEAYHFILAFLETYRYRLEEAPGNQDDYESWWHSHFGQSMGWPNQPSRRRPKKS